MAAPLPVGPWFTCQFPNSDGGIQTLQAPAFILYPNPTQNSFTIQTSNNQKQLVTLYDVTGKQVLQQTFAGTTTIDVSNFNAGVYTINITSSAGVANKRLIIVK